MPTWVAIIIQQLVNLILKYLTADVAKQAFVKLARAVAAAAKDVSARTKDGPLAGVDDVLAQKLEDVVEELAAALGVPK